MLPPLRDYKKLVAEFRWNIPPDFNIAVSACDRWALTEPGRTALLVKQPRGLTEVSYGELREQSNRLANVLHASGIERGDRVAIILPQMTETAVCHLAAYKLGAVALPLASLFGVEALAYRLENSGARVAVTNAAGLAKIMEIFDRLPALKLVLSVDGEGDGASDFHALLGRASSDFTPVKTSRKIPP